VYELKNKFQGGYGKLVTRGAKYEYDCEGNLVKKTCPHPNPEAWYYGEEKNGKLTRVYNPGPVWEYEYYSNGMLKEVVKPDGEIVSFKYDSLGRRIEKSSNSKIVKFVWDGNNPLHEWEETKLKDSLTTWVFDEGTFAPSAKLTHQGNYSIITDHLGTPVEAYDEAGKKVWEQELDIYGRVRGKPKSNVSSWANDDSDDLFDEYFVPFRYQGQYADEELDGELYYNRHRYYDPQLGQYITQDPIGLAGGNPTLYGYVGDTNTWIDPFGLDLWDVGSYNELLELSDRIDMDAHHAGQSAAMKKVVPGYVHNTGPSIMVPREGHTRVHPEAGRTLSRKATGFTNARQVLARDIMELKKMYPNIPNAQLRELINLNKKMYPEAFKRGGNGKCS